MSQKPKQSWRTWALLGVGIVVVIAVIGALTGGDDDGGTTPARSLPESQPESQPAAKDCIYRPDQPSYTGADLSGYASYLAKDDPNNCRQSFVDRVRRDAATCTRRALVYREDTSEFLGYLRSACVAAGTPIR